MSRLRLIYFVLPLVGVLACSGPGDRSDVLATAAGATWTIPEAVELIAPDPEIPATADAVHTLANLWVDYTLLATAALADPQLRNVDVGPLVEEMATEELVRALRASIIDLPREVTGEEIREAYNAEARDSFVRARHILLAWPENATDAQRDSVRQAMNEIRQRAVEEGEDFSALATEWSQDPATAGQGGDTGFFGRGEMIASFEEAAFSTPVGQVSEPVESPYGLHLLRVEERGTPSPERFQVDFINRRVAEAESLFVADLAEQAQPEVDEGAYEVVRALAENPRVRLGEMDQNRSLVTYDGGRVTAGEALRYLRNQPPSTRGQIAAARDREIPERILRTLTHRELLRWEAGRRELTLSREERGALVGIARENLVEAAAQLELLPVVVGPSESPPEAVERAVGSLLSDMLSGARTEVTPLGPMAYLLRDQFPSSVNSQGVTETVSRIEAARASGAGPSGG